MSSFPLLTFFTLCGFLSLRHLRMSISVVLTQPGCGRRRSMFQGQITVDLQHALSAPVLLTQ